MTLEQLQETLAISYEEAQKGNYDRAEQHAIEILSHIGNENVERFTTTKQRADIGSIHADALLSLAEVAWRKGDFTKALELADRALALSIVHKDTYLRAKSWNVIGNVNSDLSDYPLALEYLSKAFAAYEEYGDKSRAARVTGDIGIVYRYIADYPRALEYYGKALSLHEELGDRRGVAIVTGNIGSVYANLSDFPRALEYFGKALSAHEELGDRLGVAIATSNIGGVYYYLSDYPHALEYLGRALSRHEELGDKSAAARATGNIGNVYKKLSDYPRALEYYSKALTAHQEHGNKSGVADITGQIALVYANDDFQGYDVAKAEEYLFNAIENNEELGTKKQLYENYKALAELYENEGRWQESQKYFKKFHYGEKEIQSEEAIKQAEKVDYERKTAEREKQTAIERTRFLERENILNNILPEEITSRLIKGENPIADHFDSVSILFMDIVEFTVLSSKISAQQLVHLLNKIFTAADIVMREFGLEKIKTIGDAYMAVAGAPVVCDDHAERAANAALKLLDVMKNLVISFPDSLGDPTTFESLPEIEVRIGLHCGPAAAGVVGENKFLYDLWGDAVNTAARMESHGAENKIHVSDDFCRHLQDRFSMTRNTSHGFVFEERGEMEIKGKGMMKTYFLERE